MTLDPNAPAYPCAASQEFKGLTIRQAYAMAAMQGFLSNPAMRFSSTSDLPILCYEQADAMIAHENGEADA